MATLDTAGTVVVGLEVLSGDYEIDPANTRIGFAARYAMVTTVHGGFSDFSGRAILDGDEPARSEITLRIATDSLYTGQAQRDEHLRSTDFLDVETYPEILFRSTRVVPAGPGCFKVHGDLTVCRITREVIVDFTLTGNSADPAGRQLVGFQGGASISRAEFGLTWNTALETGGVLVGDEVSLEFDVTLARTVDSGAADGSGQAGAGKRSRWWHRSRLARRAENAAVA